MAQPQGLGSGRVLIRFSVKMGIPTTFAALGGLGLTTFSVANDIAKYFAIIAAAFVVTYTTLNVQHLESIADIVSGIIGIRVHETVPNRLFDDATEVVLVDLPPDDLLVRLDAGKVYVPVAVEHARQNFFRKGNLIALRELALRRVADRVNADVRSYRLSKSVEAVWPTRERLMICVSAA